MRFKLRMHQIGSGRYEDVVVEAWNYVAAIYKAHARRPRWRVIKVYDKRGEM